MRTLELLGPPFPILVGGPPGLLTLLRPWAEKEEFPVLSIRLIMIMTHIRTNFSFSVDTMRKGDLAPTKKKKKPTPSTLRRNARRREEFLNKKVKASTDEEMSQSEPATVKEAEAPLKTPRGLHHHPSPSTSSERRQVITVGGEKARPSFSQLDGDQPSPDSGLQSLSPPPSSAPALPSADWDELI